jgi:hypothetical protein
MERNSSNIKNNLCTICGKQYLFNTHAHSVIIRTPLILKTSPRVDLKKFDALCRLVALRLFRLNERKEMCYVYIQTEKR